jgi:hypothetical protein
MNSDHSTIFYPAMTIGIIGGTVSLYQLCSYSTAYRLIEGYTYCTHYMQPLTSRIVQGWETIKQTIEPVTTYFFRDQDCLLSRETREARERSEQETNREYPWIHVTFHDKCVETRYKTLANIPYVDCPQFIVYHVSFPQTMFKRFETIQQASQWISSQNKPIHEAIHDEYYHLPAFIQIEPHKSRKNWREIVKPFQLKNNVVLDELFVQWQTDEPVEQLFPIQFIDADIKVGQIERTQHYRIGKGVEN